MRDQDQQTPPVPDTAVNNQFVKNSQSALTTIINKLKESKLYSNKLVFWSLTTFLTLVLLIVILGTLFGNKSNGTVSNPRPTKVPFVLPSPNATPSIEVLYNSQQKIYSLKKQIEELDVRQNRLQPPDINFDIKF